MLVTYRPLENDTWSDEETPPEERQNPRFKASFDQTIRQLKEEVRRIQYQDQSDLIVIQVPYVERDLKVDGSGPKANAKPYHRGVVVSFDSIHGPLRYATDRFVSSWSGSEAWRQNLRAIALGLEDLRAVDRYGISSRGQQYTGFNALPPATPMGPAMTHEEAVEFIREQSQARSDLLTLDEMYRAAAKRLHPDVGGDNAMFVRLQEAYELVS